MIINGMRVISNPILTKSGEPEKINRTWKERLFTLPWKPLVKFYLKPTQIPSREVIIDKINMTIYAHPVVVAELKKLIDSQEN